MKKKREGLILGSLLERLGQRLGATVAIEPEWGIVGQITFKNGKRSYFRYNTLDLNPVGAADIAKDKGYATFFMKKMGYPTIEGHTFFSDEWAATIGSKRNMRAAHRYAQKIGFPVIVKPNSGSQGDGVEKVFTKGAFFSAMRRIFKRDHIALVQRALSGRDYRIVVLDNEVISAYERIPLSVVGDGRSTIRQLITRKQKKFNAAHRDTRIKLDDPRILLKLKRQELRSATILPKGRQIPLLDNANLSTGGDALDVTETLHPEWKKMAITLTHDMGLRLCGVDIMTEGDTAQPPAKYHILEINAAPGLDHYVKTGKAQEKIVENLYLKVLKSLER